MVTNINLASPESESKPKLTGKTTLVLSISLLVVTVVVYLALNFVSTRYAGQKTKIENQIAQETAKIGGAEFSDIADFQVRLDTLKKITDEHVRLDLFLRDFSKFVLPEVRVGSLAWEYEKNSLSVSGSTPNFDVLTREIILLKSSPLVQSVEFNGGDAGSEAGQNNVTFSLSIKIAKEKYNK
jgi:Tfp pilus assembly protein PilN